MTELSTGIPAQRSAEVGYISRLDHRHALAVETYRNGEYAAAIGQFDNVARQCTYAMGPTHRASLVAAGNVAVATFNAGYQRDGLALIRTAVDDRARLLGDDDPLTLSAREALATATRLTGNADLALTLALAVTAQRTRVLGPTHPDTLTSQVGLALTYAAAGDLDIARTTLHAAIDAAAEAHGHDGPLVSLFLRAGHDAALLRVVI